MGLALVGSPVGALGSPASAEGGTLVNRGEGYDFAIAGLGFHMHISESTPYERATAQFRKDQLDTSARPGDQSLIGYWTRGQFSFHRGAGIDYYELSDADAVESRFKEGSGVDPFTPGEVTLGSPFNVSALQDVRQMARVFNFLDGDYLIALRTDGTLASVPEEDFGSVGGSSVSYAGAGTGGGRNMTASPYKAYISRDYEVHSYDAGDASTTVLWTLADPCWGVYYAKTRLWMVDEYGRWFMDSTSGGTLTAADSLFIIPGRGWLAHDSDGWSVCETPRSVLFAFDHEIYRVGVDLSTASPTTTQPELVASLPTNEIISHIDYHLGRLAICTNNGVRFALEDSEGRLTYGPKVAEGVDFSSVNSISSDGSSIVIPGQGPTSFGLYYFSVANEVSDLVPGWVLRNPISGVSSPTHSGARGAFLGMYAWADPSSSVYRTALAGSLATSGTLTTAMHRFGTMESKKYHSVLVQAGGEGGTITVSKVLKGGSIVSLYTFDVSETTSVEITLGMSEPTEMVGLHFTLTRESLLVGPTLLGYQLRALPAPRRQRLIRVPLSLYDVERRGSTPARGREGAAYERLRALEDLEQSGGTFIFQDFRTGEAGQCFIESVEHKGTAPAGRQSDGYGGVIWVTLRKL